MTWREMNLNISFLIQKRILNAIENLVFLIKKLQTILIVSKNHFSSGFCSGIFLDYK